MSELTKKRVKYLQSLSWQELRRMGYRMVSRKYGCISRIDTPNWREKTSDENQYRRVYSKDSFDVGIYKARKCGTSDHDKTGYVELDKQGGAVSHDNTATT